MSPDLTGKQDGVLRFYSSYEELRAASDAYVLKPMGDEPRGIAKAQGDDVVAADGKRYLDAISGEWVVNLGYNHPAVREGIDRQLDETIYTTPVWESEPRTRFAELLAELAPGDISKTLYALSGAAAVEGAMHLAMKNTGGTDFVCLDGAFHGRTFGTIPLTYVYPEMYEESNKGLDSYLKRQIRVPQPYCYRCPLDLEPETCGVACADLVDWALERAHTHLPAGVIVEPFQANGGMVPMPDGYLKKVKGICDKHEVPLIADEVQSAFCRCGPMFGVENHDVEPDMIVLGKAMGGGMPLSATLATPECSELGAWEYGFTMAGHPVSCAAGLAMTETMVAEELPAH
ncbi:MAG: aspartate aminotransferase family protein, partial [Solirubrobacterales bacterium]